jgi:hypothetical protein
MNHKLNVITQTWVPLFIDSWRWQSWHVRWKLGLVCGRCTFWQKTHVILCWKWSAFLWQVVGNAHLQRIVFTISSSSNDHVGPALGALPQVCHITFGHMTEWEKIFFMLGASDSHLQSYIPGRLRSGRSWFLACPSKKSLQDLISMEKHWVRGCTPVIPETAGSLK